MVTIREGLHKSVFSRVNNLKEFRSPIGMAKTNRPTDLFMEKQLTPHEKMRTCNEAYEFNSLVNASLSQLCDFIVGGEIKITSRDKKTEEFYNQWFDDLNPDAFWEVYSWIKTTLKTGNAYLEVDWNPATELPKGLFNVPDSSRMYINCDMGGRPLKDENGVYNLSEYYIYDMGQGYSNNMEDMGIKDYTLTYMHMTRIRGIPIPKKKIIYARMDVGTDGIYGISHISSAINDLEIYKEISRSLGIIAKFKAVPKKLIRYGDPEKDIPANDDEIFELSQYLENLGPDENALVNKPFEIADLSFAGGEVNMDASAELFKKNIVAGTAPNFLVGLEGDTNRATAEQLLIAYGLRINTMRKVWIKLLNKQLLTPFQKRYNWLQPATFEFGDLSFEYPSDKKETARLLWGEELGTLNEARKAVGFSPILGGDVFKTEWDATQQQKLEKTFGMDVDTGGSSGMSGPGPSSPGPSGDSGPAERPSGGEPIPSTPSPAPDGGA